MKTKNKYKLIYKQNRILTSHLQWLQVLKQELWVKYKLGHIEYLFTLLTCLQISFKLNIKTRYSSMFEQATWEGLHKQIQKHFTLNF